MGWVKVFVIFSSVVLDIGWKNVFIACITLTRWQMPSRFMGGKVGQKTTGHLGERLYVVRPGPALA